MPSLDSRALGTRAMQSGTPDLLLVSQVGKDDISRRDDVSFEKGHEAVSIFLDAELQDFLVPHRRLLRLFKQPLRARATFPRQDIVSLKRLDPHLPV